MRRWQRLRGTLQPRRGAALVVVIVALALSVGLSAWGGSQAGIFSGPGKWLVQGPRRAGDRVLGNRLGRLVVGQPYEAAREAQQAACAWHLPDLDPGSEPIEQQRRRWTTAAAWMQRTTLGRSAPAARALECFARFVGPRGCRSGPVRPDRRGRILG